MKIGVIGSMQFAEKMVEVRDELKSLGHESYITSYASAFLNKTDAEKEKVKLEQKKTEDVVMEFWNLMQGGDAILVLNLDKHNIPNYVGGNALMEIGFAHVLGQKIFLWNQIPNQPYCQHEIESVHPTIINGDLSLIK